MSSILKLFSRFIGKTIISISVLVFITSFVVLALANNLDTLRSSLNSEEVLEEIIGPDSEFTLDEIKQICEKNPDEEGCDKVKDPSKLFDESFNMIDNKISSNTQNILNIRYLSIIIFLLGVGLLYLGTFSIYETGFKTSITILFSTIPFIIISYFSSNLASSDLISSLVPQAEGQQISEKLLEITIDAAKAWLDAAIQDLRPLLITLVVISLPLTILFYILKRKQSKK